MWIPSLVCKPKIGLYKIFSGSHPFYNSSTWTIRTPFLQNTPEPLLLRLYLSSYPEKFLVQENSCARVSFLIKLPRPATLLKKRLGLQHFKKETGTGVFLWIFLNFYEHLFYRIPLGDCFWLLTDRNLKKFIVYRTLMIFFKVLPKEK